MPTFLAPNGIALLQQHLLVAIAADVLCGKTWLRIELSGGEGGGGGGISFARHRVDCGDWLVVECLFEALDLDGLKNPQTLSPFAKSSVTLNRAMASLSTSSDRPKASTDTFPFPPSHSFPPFYTLQPTLLTRSTQLAKWSTLILRYHAHHHLYRLHLATALSSPLFHNPTIHKRLSHASLVEIVDYMTKSGKDGGAGGRAEWIGGTRGEKRRDEAWIWWRWPEEWAEVLAGWVDRTGQKGTVLTFWELLNGEAVRGEKWVGMEEEVLARSLDVLVKKGKAQVFGEEGERGVKFF
ncbi:MAG: hypothetical protein Q9208_000977 [Pyrenodesmia sp. 3 TL-2023]